MYTLLVCYLVLVLANKSSSTHPSRVNMMNSGSVRQNTNVDASKLEFHKVAGDVTVVTSIFNISHQYCIFAQCIDLARFCVLL